MNADNDSPEEVENVVKLLLDNLSRGDLSTDEKLNRLVQMGLTQVYIDKAKKMLASEVNLEEEDWEKVRFKKKINCF